MTTRTLRATLLVASAVLSLGVSACGGLSVSVDETPATSVTPAFPGALDGATGPGTAAAPTLALPPFPVPRVPDITTLTGSAASLQKAIGGAGSLPVGVQVTGARCNAQGQVVNRSGLTVGGGDDGSQVVNRAGVSQVGKGGSGQITDGKVVYQVNADGSGQYTNSGENYQVDVNGSGQWTGPYGVIQNKGDGTGTWTSPDGVISVKGDGTATVDGIKTVLTPAMPKFALLGTFPKLGRLKPVGKPCGTLIRIPSEVLFDFDKATLRPEAAPVLANVAKALVGTTAPIQVNGHTDALGSDAYNLDLSRRRAASVIAALRTDGVTAPLDPQGYGEAQPVAPNTLSGKDNPGGRQLNRRVEIVIPGA